MMKQKAKRRQKLQRNAVQKRNHRKGSEHRAATLCRMAEYAARKPAVDKVTESDQFPFDAVGSEVLYAVIDGVLSSGKTRLKLRA